MQKIIFSLLCFVLFTLFYPKSAFASENFIVTGDATYNVLQNGTTHVLLSMKLTNTSGQYYASSYKIQVGFDHIANVQASDPDGAIKPITKKQEDGQSIELTFNKRVTGIGNVLPFTVSFDTNEIANKQGAIWEINIPGLSSQTDFASFDVHVVVPASFGEPSYIKPASLQSTTSGDRANLTFTKDQLQKSGISIGYGDTQLYTFALSYHLKNSNLFPIRTEIAIPPTTNYQDVFIENITPKPSNVVQDRDGNWIAQYTLMPSEKKDVIVKGKAKLFLYPKKQILTEQEKALYLRERPYWQTKDKKILELVGELRTPLAIYQYVVKKLTYDYSRVTDQRPRLGAVAALQTPSSAVCLEFTDLFVALARAAGIPAREVNGFAYTENDRRRPLSLVKDILHAWPEYYDEELETWIMVDPTWGNTTGGVDYFHTLDFDHFAFTILGQRSDYPVPAGGYKLAGGEETKDVAIDFTTEIAESQPSLGFQMSISSTFLSGFPIKGTARLENLGSTVIPSQTIIVQSSKNRPVTQSLKTNNIPPFGFAAISFYFDKTPILTNYTDIITIRVAEKSVQQKIRVIPFFLTKWVVGGGIISAICLLIISVVAINTRGVPFFRREKPGTIRRESKRS